MGWAEGTTLLLVIPGPRCENLPNTRIHNAP
jgi:hypothetical protein